MTAHWEERAAHVLYTYIIICTDKIAYGSVYIWWGGGLSSKYILILPEKTEDVFTNRDDSIVFTFCSSRHQCDHLCG